MLYQLSYLGIARPRPRPRGGGCITHADRGSSRESPFRYPDGGGSSSSSRADPECDIGRSASGRDRPRRSAACRTAGAPSEARRPQIGQVGAGLAILRLHDPAAPAGMGLPASSRSRPVRRARSDSAAGSACRAATTGRCARSAGRPRGSRPESPSTARRAARPAACGPAQKLVQRRVDAGAHDFGQAQRGEAQKPRTQRIIRQHAGRNPAPAPPACAPANRPDRSRWRRTGCAA